MRFVLYVLLMISFFSYKTLSAASIAISSGTGLDDTLIQSGEISSTSANGLLFSADLIDDFPFFFDTKLDLSVELAGYQLKGRHNNVNEEMYIYQIKPKLRWHFDANYYFDFGLGFATLEDDQWEEVKFNGTTNFAMSFALGMSFGEEDQLFLDLVYNHYSNGYTRSPNPGLDILTLNLGYVF